jgi:hypothetical protein
MQKFEIVASSEVKIIGARILKLMEKEKWSPVSVYVACRELALFLESEGVSLIEYPGRNPVN